MNATRWGLIAAVAAGVAWAQFAPGDKRPWEAADAQVLRLPPNAFTELPAAVMADLTQRGCTIPQVPDEQAGKLQNVVKGEFAKPGQTDWAVLCSVNRVSSVLVYWGGSAKDVAKIETRRDVDSLQGWGGTKIIYSRHLGIASPAFITEHYKAYGGPKPPALDHEGIDDQFWGKASVVLYFDQGKWLRLTGAD